MASMSRPKCGTFGESKIRVSIDGLRSLSAAIVVVPVRFEGMTAAGNARIAVSHAPCLFKRRRPSPPPASHTSAIYLLSAKSHHSAK